MPSQVAAILEQMPQPLIFREVESILGRLSKRRKLDPVIAHYLQRLGTEAPHDIELVPKLFLKIVQKVDLLEEHSENQGVPVVRVQLNLYDLLRVFIYDLERNLKVQAPKLENILRLQLESLNQLTNLRKVAVHEIPYELRYHWHFLNGSFEVVGLPADLFVKAFIGVP